LQSLYGGGPAGRVGGELPRGQRHAERPGDAERRRTAYGKGSDRGDQVVHRGDPQHALLAGSAVWSISSTAPIHPVDRPHA
jgi:hypothetical protein